MLKRLRRVAPFLLFGIAALCLFSATISSKMYSHGLMVQGLVTNLGSVKRGDGAISRLRLINLTADPVRFYALPSCGCTSVDLPNSTVAPLHLVTITVRIDTNKVAPGINHKNVLLYLASNHMSWQQNAFITFNCTQG